MQSVQGLCSFHSMIHAKVLSLLRLLQLHLTEHVSKHAQAAKGRLAVGAFDNHDPFSASLLAYGSFLIRYIAQKQRFWPLRDLARGLRIGQ